MISDPKVYAKCAMLYWEQSQVSLDPVFAIQNDWNGHNAMSILQNMVCFFSNIQDRPGPGFRFFSGTGC